MPMAFQIGAASAADETIINAIAKNWAIQQEEVRSIKFSWKSAVTIPKGTVRTSEESKREARNAKDFFPEKDTTLEETNTLMVDKNNWRYETDGYGIDSSRREFISQHSVTTSKDGIGKCYIPKGIYAYPLGNIVNMKGTDYPQDISVRPLFQVFRSLRTGLFKSKEYTVLQDRGVVDGHSCLLLQTIAGISPKCCLWVDSERDYLVRRYTLSNEKGKVFLETTLSYSLTMKKRWLPSSWKVVNVNEQSDLAQSIISTVTDSAINTPFDEHDFDITFPPGTKVRDLRGETTGKELTQYIAREGGEKRMITPQERRAPYEELLNTESGQAIPTRRQWPFASSWFWLTSIGVFVGCLLLNVLRRVWKNRTTGR